MCEGTCENVRTKSYIDEGPNHVRSYKEFSYSLYYQMILWSPNFLHSIPFPTTSASIFDEFPLKNRPATYPSPNDLRRLVIPWRKNFNLLWPSISLSRPCLSLSILVSLHLILHYAKSLKSTKQPSFYQLSCIIDNPLHRPGRNQMRGELNVLAFLHIV